ncbi:MAG: TspO/MBR family protein [Micromonosporaceae bacterium]
MTGSRIRARPHSGTASLLGLVGFGAVVAAVALVGSLAVDGGRGYARLDRPAWAPPGWVFAPVWTVLYASIAVAGWLVWRRVGLGPPLVPYAVQLLLNAVWTPLFFGAGAYGPATVDVVLLWLAIGATVVVFHRVHRVAAWLLVPYWAWVTYAAALTVAIWWRT